MIEMYFGFESLEIACAFVAGARAAGADASAPEGVMEGDEFPNITAHPTGATIRFVVVIEVEGT